MICKQRRSYVFDLRAGNYLKVKGVHDVGLRLLALSHNKRRFCAALGCFCAFWPPLYLASNEGNRTFLGGYQSFQERHCVWFEIDKPV